MKPTSLLAYALLVWLVTACSNNGSPTIAHHFVIQGAGHTTNGTCTPYTVTREDSSNTPSNPPRDSTLQVSVLIGSGGIYGDSGCASLAGATLVMHTNQNVLTFYFKGDVPGTFTLEASSSDLPGDTKAQFQLSST